MPTDRRDLRRRLFNVAAQQAGYFTAAQAKEVGYSYQAQAHHRRAGNWIRMDRGLFRLSEWIPGIHDDLVRWTLWSKGRAVVSHQTALAVHGIGEFESPKVHLTVPRSFTMDDDAVLLHRSNLGDDDVLIENGFRLTTPLRSVIDVAASSPDPDQLARAIDDALQKGLVTIRRLRGKADAFDARAALNVERALQRLENP